jgi:protein-disulfide isomerase
MLHEQTIKRVKAEYALKGRIRLVHHDFPLPMHKHARRAAALAAAADRFGKFDAVADALFLQQDTWSKTGNVDDVVDGVLTPEERKKIDQIAAEPEIAAAIERDVQLGTRSQVRSTPTMIITHNGKPNPVVGAVSYPVLSKFLDSLLGPAK